MSMPVVTVNGDSYSARTH